MPITDPLIHGPQICECPCYECDHGHHWMENSLAPDEEEMDAHQVLAYDREHSTEHALAHLVCKVSPKAVGERCPRTWPEE
jgi:hypothetical protein